ncbi:uncharacterized protein F5147DRAFT_762057 [Suillus discolor]|uniref:Fungal STAND N-terminal Goodbye domain-containing protein n=1 Tax=Suillus discolor TaxID=1912936 RepID=A0A9P7JSD7_9AGAM|nr:uncharacterized protein F5147DRAFT_762057 [Suillus discolor]KAG2104713.1 hypothetical protein F5147DRAFT_762057 [Suillus discolor]
MSKDNHSSRDSARETHTPSQATAPGSSHRPRGKIGRFLKKLKEDAKKLQRRSKDSRSHSPAPPNVSHDEPASSTLNIEAQAGPSGVKVEDDVQLVLRDAQVATEHMHSPSGHVITVASAGKDAQEDLDTAGKFGDTYLKPLKIFDAVIGEITDLHPYAKMALGVLSCAAKIILAQADRDAAVLKLLEKLCQVYSFITQDQMPGQISSMRIILGQISQQTLECAQFIKNYSETKSFWKRLGKNVMSETKDTIQQYSDVLDTLMQNFRDQVAHDVAIHIHRTGKGSNVLVI